MKSYAAFNRRPIIVAIAGPNGAGKTTFYHAHLASTALRLINADVIAREVGIDPYTAARIAASVRDELVRQRESFVFETVFSDPVGDKLAFLETGVRSGYTVVLCFIGVAGPKLSEERVAIRVSQGGHDVPSEKLKARFPRVLTNLKRAIRTLPHVLIFDNSDTVEPFRLIAICESGQIAELVPLVPPWVRSCLTDLRHA